MKVLIIYASNNDTTKICSDFLAEKLPEATVANLKKEKPDPNLYDTIVIGSCIRFNLVHNNVLTYVKENMDTLMKKNTAVFLCCGFPEKTNQYLLHNFPKSFLDKCFSIKCFGGRIKVKTHRIHEQLLIKTVQKGFKDAGRELTEIDYDSINEMAEEIRSI